MHTGRMHMNMEAEIKVICIQANGHPKSAANHLKLAERCEVDSLSQSSVGTNLLKLCFWTSSLQNVRKYISGWLKQLSLQCLVTATPGM